VVEEDSPTTAERAFGEGGNDRLNLNTGGPADTINGGHGHQLRRLSGLA
jgi:hypothetical protein